MVIDDEQFLKVFDPHSSLSPSSDKFDLAEFRAAFAENKEPEDLPPSPLPAILYRVVENGFVTIMVSALQEGSSASTYAATFEKGALAAFGGASAQRDITRGIKNIDNSATLPVRVGDTFQYFGSATPGAFLRAAFVPVKF